MELPATRNRSECAVPQKLEVFTLIRLIAFNCGRYRYAALCMNLHELIDRLATSIAEGGHVIQPISEAPWITKLEQRLPKRLPASFRSLVTRYAFPPLQVGGLELFGNMGTDDLDEMSIAIFQDAIIAEGTMRAGYIQFARPDTGSYDPICFDARRTVNNREFAIVRLDHEELLLNDRIHVSGKVADSFYQFACSVVNFT